MTTTEKKLIAALGTLLAEYADIDAMLESFASCGPDGMTPAERRSVKASNRARDKIQKLYARTLETT